MKLLICTQKVDKNDPVLGFFHRWIEEFAKHCEEVHVICLEEGMHALPDNVSVYSLGKEKRKSRIAYIFNFYLLIFGLRRKYDTVFVHMNPEYVVLGGVPWRIMRKRIMLWYAHKSIGFKLRVAVLLAHHIFTPTKESFNLQTKKLSVVGHGIDTEQFLCTHKADKDSFDIVSVGRITEIKRCHVLINAGVLLSKMTGASFKIIFIGDAVSAFDRKYLAELKALSREDGVRGRIEFKGPVPFSQIVEEYCSADCIVNMAPTGGADKAVLEAMSCERITLASNKAFIGYFGQYASMLSFKQDSPIDLANKIKNIIDLKDKSTIEKYLRAAVVKKSNVGSLIPKIISICAQ